MKEKLILLTLIVMFFSGLAATVSVGAAPGNINYGQVEPGETVTQEVHVTTNHGSNFTVEPEANSDTSTSIFDSAEDPSRVSEHGSDEWFSSERVVVDPSDTQSVTLPDGSPANVEGTFELNMDVPEDAEPGVHYGTISLNPDLSGNQSQAGAITVGKTRISYTVDVYGDNVEEARRDLVVQDVRGFRTDEDIASVEVLVSNQGSVTTSSQDFTVQVLNSEGTEVKTLEVSGMKLEPGETEWTNAAWIGDDVEEGTYQIDGEVDYFTGDAYASGSFSLGEIVEVVPEDSPESDSDDDDKETMPMWLVFMVLAILAVLMWSFDIEPFWILAIIGGLAIASFILLTGISNYLLVVLLMAVGIVFYGVM